MTATAAARDAALQVASVVDGVPLRRPSAIEARWEPTGTATEAETAAHYARLILKGAG